MDKETYKIISAFECDEKKMLVVGMSGAACVMSEEDYNRIITEERKYRQMKHNEVA